MRIAQPHRRKTGWAPTLQFPHKNWDVLIKEKVLSLCTCTIWDWLLPFKFLWEKLKIDSILNMLFDLIYIILENILGFLIYFSSDSETSVFWKYFISYFDIQVSLRAAYFYVLQLEPPHWDRCCIWRHSLSSAENEATFMKFLFSELHFLWLLCHHDIITVAAKGNSFSTEKKKSGL